MSNIRVDASPEAEKKRVLVATDGKKDREALGAALGDGFDLRWAATGGEALARVEAERDSLSLALLDLTLPDMSGLEVLRRLREAGLLARLPVIVLTSDRDAEAEGLAYGAMDFIPRPYPRREVIAARVQRTIELSEGRIIIGRTERDPLTGLYNREYFYRYAEQFDLRHRDAEMDAVVVDINHFHLLNERYGRACGDDVLRRVADRLTQLVPDEKGILCRRSADLFLVYRVHSADYSEMLESLSDAAAGEGKASGAVRMRMGVYSGVDKSIDIERRFDRAKMASDTVRSTFTKAVAIYDSALHESAMFAEQLMEDFERAEAERQFEVYYQPKYDVRGETPALCSAEALVRWNHPEFGMLGPGVFVPLFEGNGLIGRLDRYVWREAARQLREWKDRLGGAVPVSVNVSRIDMADPHLPEQLISMVGGYGVAPGELLLEITESAYTEDSEQMIETVNRLREAGFHIEMDDFGSGYSSLNMLSSLPIDALKLDMQFIRNAFKNGKNTRMLEVVIEIADSLAVPVVAEGVETAEQMFTLKSMGCDIVQGYYFSKPVPAREFEKLMAGRRPAQTLGEPVRKPRGIAHDRHTYGAMHDPLTGLYNNSAFDILLYDADMKHTAVLLADVDGYAELLAGEGREAADRAILRAAAALRDSFRATDFVCRLRDDEFAVILTRVDSSQRDVIFDKVVHAGAALRGGADGAPPLTLSAGIAFGDRENPRGDLFQDADAALEKARKARKSGCVVY